MTASLELAPVRTGSLAAGALAMERVIARGAEVLAAVLVLADTVILFVGVISRYALNSPITWTDELASTLFLWMVMLGSVVALDRGEHMRLVLGRGWMRPEWQRRLGAFGVVVTLLFVTARAGAGLALSGQPGGYRDAGPGHFGAMARAVAAGGLRADPAAIGLPAGGALQPARSAGRDTRGRGDRRRAVARASRRSWRSETGT